MSKKLLEITGQTKELRITSVELVDIVNQFREMEFEILKEKGLNKKNKYAELQHKNFMAKIRKELEVLETLGLEGEYFILSSYIDKKGEARPCFSLNKEGLKYLLDLTKSKDKIAMQKVYESMGGDYSKTICIDRFETTFFNKLSDTLSVMNIELDRQKISCSKYRLDGYLPQYNLAIEYDEAQHYVEPQKSKDIKRQKAIEKELGCQFVRLDYRNTDAYNIGLVLNKVFNVKSNT